jgi:hypothetical protein
MQQEEESARIALRTWEAIGNIKGTWWKPLGNKMVTVENYLEHKRNLETLENMMETFGEHMGTVENNLGTWWKIWRKRMDVKFGWFRDMVLWRIPSRVVDMVLWHFVLNIIDYYTGQTVVWF